MGKGVLDIVVDQICFMIAAHFGYSLGKVLNKVEDHKFYKIYMCIIVGLYTLYNVYRIIGLLCQ